jgi:uncharacterized repeat protein (TIGR01451 family)
MPLGIRAICDKTFALRLSRAAAATCTLLTLTSGCFASNAFGALPGEPETLASSPVQLTSVAADPSSGILYAQENQGKRFFSYNASANTWTELAEAPVSSQNNGGAAYADGKIYTDYTQNSSILGVYDISTGSWTTIANPLGKGTVDITAVGDELYMAVGQHFVEYNTESEETTTLANPPAFTTGLCPGRGLEAWGGLQYFKGMLYADQGDSCNGFAIYDVASDTWTEQPLLPLAAGQGPVAGSALDPVAGAYFAQGGYGGDQMFRYEISTGEWTLTTLPFTVNDGGMAYVSQPGWRGIYAIQGQEATGFVRYVTREPEADLSLLDNASAPKATVGETFTYTIAASNAGPNEAAGTIVTDVLPTNVSFVSAQATQGVCSGSTTVICELGALESAAGATVTITVKASAAGTATDASSVTSSTPDPSSANNNASATTTISALDSAATPTPATATVAASLSPHSTVCKSTRSELIHWAIGKGVRLQSVSIMLNGVLYSRLPGDARQTNVSLVGRTAGAVVVSIVGATGSGKRYTGTRVYHPCADGSQPGTVHSLYLVRSRS